MIEFLAGEWKRTHNNPTRLFPIAYTYDNEILGKRLTSSRNIRVAGAPPPAFAASNRINEL